MLIAIFIFIWAVSIPDTPGGYGGMVPAAVAMGVFFANILFLIIKFLLFSENKSEENVQEVRCKNKLFENIYAIVISSLVVVIGVTIFCFGPILNQLISMQGYSFLYLFLFVGVIFSVLLIIITLPARFIKKSISYKRILKIEIISLYSTLMFGFILAISPYTREIMKCYSGYENIF